MAEGSLNVIALVSGGKDSFFSILHCLANGHRVVALANLYPQSSPASTSPAAAVAIREPSQDTPLQQQQKEPQEDEDEADLNSFMYQTVGHQVIPLYARATGLPLFRHPIVGGAVHHGLNYQAPQEREEGSRTSAAAAVGTTVILPSSADESPTISTTSATAATSTATLQIHAGTGAAGAQEQEPEREREQGQSQGQYQDKDQDETESLVPLLRAVLAAHPEANALSTGAILSTYQRTRVESVALRLGLVPLSYLWQYPELPLDRGDHNTNNNSNGDGDDNATSNNNVKHDANDATGKAGRVGGITTTTRKSTGQQQQQQLWKTLGLGQAARRGAPLKPRDDAQLLLDMAAAGFDARIIKVASAGLDESFLWENVASEAGARRVARGIARFGMGTSRGSVLGEGGEFETLVVDGPPALFRGGRIVVVPEEGSSGGGGNSNRNMRVVREGGGSVWLSVSGAVVEARGDEGGDDGDSGAGDDDGGGEVRIPCLLDPRFEDTLEALLLPGEGETDQPSHDAAAAQLAPLGRAVVPSDSTQQQWCFVGRDDGHNDQAGGVEAQTARVVAGIREQLQTHALPASAITNATIVLRRMADFPAINTLYGSLFTEPNPPARVTISCGDALPAGCDIAVYLAVATSHSSSGDSRLGLHVQSRSYWAPANIGPYSQAISIPLLSPPPPPPVASSSDDEGDDDDQLYYSSDSSTDTGLAVSIAGQIPLIPSSMVLPSADFDDVDGTSDRNLALQTTLALQHLWRVAAAVDVQWWTSAVAYFPRVFSSSSSADQDEQQRRTTAQLAAAAWLSAHVWGPVGDGDDGDDGDDDSCCGGPDLWDRRFNAAYQSFGNEEADKVPEVPDWEVLAIDDKKDADTNAQEKRREQRQRCVPFFFAAEVDELPRQAGIEWHAHLGLAKLQPGSVRVFSRREEREGEGRSLEEEPPACVSSEIHHVAVETPHGGVFVQSAAAVRRPRLADSDVDLESVISDLRREVAGSRAAASAAAIGSADDTVTNPHLVYVDAGVFPTAFAQSQPQAIVPCRSLWDPCGNRLALVVIFQSRFLPGTSK